MPWNYRVIQRTDQGETSFAIHLAFYDSREDEKPHSISANEYAPCALNIDELRQELDRMKEALDKPILEYDDF